MLRYFKNKLSVGFLSIYFCRMLLHIAGGLLGMFLPIFLYTIFAGDLDKVFAYFLFSHLFYALGVAWGCQYLNKVGVKRSLQISIVFEACYYLVLYFVDKTIGPTWILSWRDPANWLLWLSLLLLTLNRMSYWVPMQVDLAKFTSRGGRGREIGLMQSTILMIGAIMPIVAGWLLSHYSYGLVLILSFFLYLTAIIPLTYLPDYKEKFSWTYLRTWREFFSRKRRRTVMAFLGDGAEGAVGLIVWPIFIWQLFKGDYFQIGVLSSFIVIVTIVLQLLMGVVADSGNKKKMLHWGNALYALGWVVKIFIATAFQVFVVSIYHNLTKIFARTPFDVLTYEKAANQGHYVDEYTAIHEMALHWGKVLMLLFVIISLKFFSLQWTFLLAALASLAMNYLAEEEAEVRE